MILFTSLWKLDLLLQVFWAYLTLCHRYRSAKYAYHVLYIRSHLPLVFPFQLGTTRESVATWLTIKITPTSSTANVTRCSTHYVKTSLYESSDSHMEKCVVMIWSRTVSLWGSRPTPDQRQRARKEKKTLEKAIYNEKENKTKTKESKKKIKC